MPTVAASEEGRAQTEAPAFRGWSSRIESGLVSGKVSEREVKSPVDERQSRGRDPKVPRSTRNFVGSRGPSKAKNYLATDMAHSTVRKGEKEPREE